LARPAWVIQVTTNQKGEYSVVSDNVPHDDLNAEKPSVTLIPVQVEHVDQLVLIARDLAGFIIICCSSRRAIGAPTVFFSERLA
jgi:hypothetical protein